MFVKQRVRLSVSFLIFLAALFLLTTVLSTNAIANSAEDPHVYQSGQQALGVGAVITVTTTDDELNNDGDCSLREAVQAANTDSSVDACTAGSGGDSVVLDSATYTLSIVTAGGVSEDDNISGDLDIVGELTIAGSGSANTILQAGTNKWEGIDRVLHGLAGSHLMLQDLTVRYGHWGGYREGGGIRIEDNGQLALERCLITQNSGVNYGAISSGSGATIDIKESVVSENQGGNGGGLYIRGDGHLDKVSFSGNRSEFGGAVNVSGGTLRVQNSTFANNAATLVWVPDAGFGGAIQNSGTLIIENSTFSANSADIEGGAIRNFGYVAIANSTFAKNSAPSGGGILNLGGDVLVANSIIAGNDGEDCSGDITSLGYNVDTDNSCELTVLGDQPATYPFLGPLQDNGGSTWTHALLVDSPAIDAGNPDGCTNDEGLVLGFDQRSVPRVGPCDIGAYEFNPANPPSVDFSAAPKNGVLPLEVQFTNLSIGDFDQCLWDFGDGNSSNSCDDPSHTYNQAGDYSVSLTVQGLGGENTVTKTNFVTVYEPPTADFIALPTSGIAPLSVEFTNLSTGDYIQCTWEFGDYTAAVTCDDVTHVYSNEGHYTVNLLVEGMDRLEYLTTDYITVFEPAKADFIASPTSGIPPLAVDFTNLSTGDYDQCLWDFGDTTTSDSCQDPSHIYHIPGIFTVSLTVDGSGGNDVMTETGYITVYEPTTAAFNASPTSGPSPLVVSFTNLSTGDFDRCLWDFGDGNSSNSCDDPSHTYNQAGDYSVSLTVQGLGGENTVTKTDYVTVYEPPIAAFSASPEVGTPPLVVAFTNLSTGDFDHCLWGFGDNETAVSCDDSTHKYMSEGQYTVSLTVKGAGGEDTMTVEECVKVAFYRLYLPGVLANE